MYIIDWLSQQANHRPDKIALVDVDTQRKVTYLQFDTRASRFAEFLRDEWKVKKGDRVAVLAYNSSDYLEMLYGCAKIGAIMVCLNWRLSVAELAFIIADAKPGTLIFGKDFMEQGKALMQYSSIKHGMVVDGDADLDDAPNYEACLAKASGKRMAMPNWPMDEPWHLLYTSGTTGKPKGVLQTYGMVFFNAVNCMLHASITKDDVLLNVLPFFHTGGLNLFANPLLFCGGTVHVTRQFDVNATVELLNTEITMFLGVPAVYLFISQHPKFKEYPFKNIRYLAAGGSPISNSLLEEYLAKGLPIHFGFGMTETGPTVFLTDADTATKKIGSVGKPVIFSETRIVDEQGNDVKPGERGELIIRGPGITPGYWKLPEITEQTIIDGWLHSGDIAYADADGDYYIVDRSKDMYISGGENVYPAEIENVLYELPAVKEVALIGVADEKWGEVGKAIIALVPGQTLTEEDARKHCRAKLAGYKVPKYYVFVDVLPRNAAGKVEKHALRKTYAE